WTHRDAAGPEPSALGSDRFASALSDVLAADAHLGVRVRLEVLPPRRVAIRAHIRRDHDIGVAIGHVVERHVPRLPALPARRRDQQRVESPDLAEAPAPAPHAHAVYSAEDAE